MSDTKVTGGRYLLQLDLNGGTDYDIVVCLTNVGISRQVNVQDSSSACGPDKSPSTVDISYSGEGQFVIAPELGKVSVAALKQACQSKTTVGFLIGPMDSDIQSGDVTETGTGFISQFDESYPFDNVATFTMSLQPYGTPVITEES